MSKSSIKKMTLNKKMAKILTNNCKNLLTMQSTLMKKINNKLSGSTWRMSNKKTDNNFKEFSEETSDDTTKTCLNYSKCRRMNVTGMIGCKK